MEVLTVNHGSVAIPDAIASGAAGTGQEHGIAAVAGPGCDTKKQGQNRRVTIGPGLLSPGNPQGGNLPAARAGTVPGADEDPDEWYGDPAFPLTGGLEGIGVRLDKKIDRQGRRLEKIEERGWSE
jgi:hypothetical protein